MCVTAVVQVLQVCTAVTLADEVAAGRHGCLCQSQQFGLDIQPAARYC